MKTRAIPCPHHPPTRGDNTVSVAQGGTAADGATKQFLPPDSGLKELYIYICVYMCVYARSINSRNYIRRSSSFWVCKLWFKKKRVYFRPLMSYTFTITVSWCYAIIREWWFCVHFIHAENFSLSTKSNLMHIALRSEDDLRQLSNYDQRFLFLKETKWLSVLENHDNQPQ